MNDEIKLSGREKALLSRGYTLKDILEVSRISKEETQEYASRIFCMITKDAAPEEKPVVIFVGAQPGGGKSSMIRAKLREGREYPMEEPPVSGLQSKTASHMNLPQGEKSVFSTSARDENASAVHRGSFVVLAMDNYRTFHPRYKELERIILEHWKGRTETYLDSPGSDIADFTQLFAGDVVDLLEEMVSGKMSATGLKYNVLYEWAMRMSEEPLNSMRRLKERGYRVVVSFIAVNRRISLTACRQRSERMNSKGRVLRTIPDNFHELSVERLPDAINEIYRTGFLSEKVIDRFRIIDRGGKSIWDEEQANGSVYDLKCASRSDRLPGDVFKEVLWNGPLDIENSDEFSEDAYWQEIQGLKESKTPDEK